MKIKLDKNKGFLPTRAHEDDAGLDILASEDAVIPPNDFATVETGLHVEIPKGCVGLLTSKSGLMTKHGITSRGTIDCGYTGEIRVTLFNGSSEQYEVHKGDKISQLVILPIITPDLVLVDDLGETDRGDNGFGSTGR